MNQRTPCASTGEFFNTIRQKRSFVRPLDLGGRPTNGTALPFSTLDSDDDRGADTEHVSCAESDESYHARRDGTGQYHGRMPSLEAGLKRLNYYLIENLETVEDLRVTRWVHSSSDGLVLCYD
jgi:hypothetical protein